MKVTDLINKQVDVLQGNFEGALKARMKELGLPILDETTIKEYRFNPYLCISDLDSSYYYYNDGTKNGKFILGIEHIVDFESNGFGAKVTQTFIYDEPDKLKIKQ